MEENKDKMEKFVIRLVIIVIIMLVAIIIITSLLIFRLISNKMPGVHDNYSAPAQNVIDNTIENNVIDNSLPTSQEIEVVPTLLDRITTNSVWCGTFQLVWNDMQNEVIKQDIVFNPQISIVENLNKQSFKEKDISEEYYYKAWGLKTLNLKDKIESGIKEKFDQESDILKLLNWDNVPVDDSGYLPGFEEYLFYTMLYREFNFNNEFTVLDNDQFKGSNKVYDNVEYFGINGATDHSVYKQVTVLYYNSEDDFAVVLNTQEGDEVILAKGENGNTFEDIYNSIINKSDKYEGIEAFTKNDTLKVPKIKFDILKEYEDLEGQKFLASDGDACQIAKALQTIKFELNEKGGKIKSEAAIDLIKTTAISPTKVEYRYFDFDGTYTMFLRETGKELPYFATNVDDISLYQ